MIKLWDTTAWIEPGCRLKHYYVHNERTNGIIMIDFLWAVGNYY